MSLLRALAERLTRPDIVVRGDRAVINRAPKGLVLNFGALSHCATCNRWLGAGEACSMPGCGFSEVGARRDRPGASGASVSSFHGPLNSAGAQRNHG